MFSVKFALFVLFWYKYALQQTASTSKTNIIFVLWFSRYAKHIPDSFQSGCFNSGGNMEASVICRQSFNCQVFSIHKLVLDSSMPLR